MQYKDMMRRAQEMQTKMKEVQDKLGEYEATGKSGGGLVQIVLTGKGHVKSVSIDPSLMRDDEREVLEDLISAAFTDAQHNVNTHMQEEMSKVTGGLPVGGLF